MDGPSSTVYDLLLNKQLIHIVNIVNNEIHVFRHCRSILMQSFDTWKISNSKINVFLGISVYLTQPLLSRSYVLTFSLPSEYDRFIILWGLGTFKWAPFMLIISTIEMNWTVMSYRSVYFQFPLLFFLISKHISPSFLQHSLMCNTFVMFIALSLNFLIQKFFKIFLEYFLFFYFQAFRRFAIYSFFHVIHMFDYYIISPFIFHVLHMFYLI